MIILSLTIEENKNGIIYVYPEGSIYEPMEMYGGISENMFNAIDYGEVFENKETFVNFIEDMERKAARENKTLKDVLIKHTDIQFP